MRDGQILGIAGNIEFKVGRDITALHELNLLCRTRIDAIEDVLFGGRGSLLWCLILSVFAPRALRERVEQSHEGITAQWNEAAAVRVKEMEKKNRITVMGNGHG